jgi:hypothetical protein
MKSAWHLDFFVMRCIRMFVLYFGPKELCPWNASFYDKFEEFILTHLVKAIVGVFKWLMVAGFRASYIVHLYRVHKVYRIAKLLRRGL